MASWMSIPKKVLDKSKTVPNGVAMVVGYAPQGRSRNEAVFVTTEAKASAVFCMGMAVYQGVIADEEVMVIQGIISGAYERKKAEVAADVAKEVPAVKD